MAAALFAALLNWSGIQSFAQGAGDPVLRVRSPFAGDIWRADVRADESYISVSSAYASVSSGALDVPGVSVTARCRCAMRSTSARTPSPLHPSGDLVAYSVPPLIAERDSYQPGSSVIVAVSVPVASESSPTATASP